MAQLIISHKSTVKNTHTDQILNFNSNHPTQHKIRCIRTLFNRIDTHCNTKQAKQTERRYLYSTFMKNNYPKNFINKVLTNVRNQRQINKSNEQPEQRKTTITLPYINNTSEMAARLLRPFNITEHINQHINSGHISQNTKTKHPQLKQKMPSR